MVGLGICIATVYLPVVFTREEHLDEESESCGKNVAISAMRFCAIDLKTYKSVNEAPIDALHSL